jgi:hypothetical protein
MEERLKSTMSLLDGHLTPRYSNRLQNKRYSFKKHNYRNRMTYGTLTRAGIVSETLRTLPWIFQDERNKNEILNSITVPKHEVHNNTTNDEENSVLSKLIHDADFNLALRKSKREIKLRGMLIERIKTLANNTNDS